ncbi:unnamed protein product [Adineta steineri]|uniref:Uncharacterized protein n=1 Tax=Adineta steineri TaxID=433720 RepID=A0A816DKA7_9BILA|nr:unnamed protein product [Adineta steineri]CAF1637122.1 unnamed protein product [Adineta steineri]
MTAATCHFLPLSAAQNIAACNITTKRQKRLITDVISIGMGAINLGISAANSMQISNLQQQVAVVEKALTEYSQNLQIQGAQLAKIHSNQIELADELQVTQQALNAMVPILSSHSEAINTLKTGIERLHIQLQRSMLYLAITQILRNDLTLDFLSPDDLYKVVYHVIQQGSLTFNSEHASLPIVQIITKLLVRQQIDFVPSSHYKTQNPQEIGRLVITSFFAVPQQKHTSFLTYKLLAIPFFHKNQTLQLTQIPRYWAINLVDNTTMEWHDPQEFGCDLQLMTSCRDTPPIQTMSQETCLGQILGSLPLSICQTIILPPAKFFVRPLRDNLYVTSSSEPLHCLNIPETEYSIIRQQTLNLNEELVLAPVALVNVTPGYTIVCPKFTLVGRAIPSGAPSLVILYNNSLLTNNISVVDVNRYLKENTSWFNTRPGEQRMDALMKRIREPFTVPVTKIFEPSRKWWSLPMSIIGWILFRLGCIIVYLVFRFKPKRIFGKH